MSSERHRGAGTLGTSIGVVVFILLMLAAVQVLYDLYATTMVTSSAIEAAREVAGHDAAADRCAEAERAELGFLESLGAYARDGHVTVSWTCAAADAVRMEIRATHPSILPPTLDGLLGLGSLERTIEVRSEEPR